MNRFRTSWLLIVVVLAAAVAFAQMPSPFSADMKMSNARQTNMTGKMYFSGQKVRMDMNAAGHSSAVISDLPSRTVYMIMPQQRMYMEMKADQMPGGKQQWKPYDAANPCANEAGVTCKKLGTEMVNGRMCDKWLFTGGAGGERTVWIDQRSHIPIKTVMPDGSFELTNVKEGPQPASLFEVPAGFTKMDMGGMMQGMPNVPRP